MLQMIGKCDDIRGPFRCENGTCKTRHILSLAEQSPAAVSLKSCKSYSFVLIAST